MWFGRAGVIGNATGGTADLYMIFQPQTTLSLDSNMYSLEQVSATGDGDFTLTCLNLGLLPSLGVMGDLGQQWSVRMDGSGASKSPALNNMLARGLFLGGQVAEGYDSGLLAYWTNSNTTDFIFTCMGYIWGAAARSAPGGPRRPPGSLF
jgi:hypothetical protein